MVRTRSAGGVVLNQDGKVLVVDQNGTSWSLPKGHIEKGENILNAAKREIYEESGISKLEFVKSLGSYKRMALHRPDEVKTIYIFLFRANQNRTKVVDHHNQEAKWIPKSKVTAILTHPKDKEFFESILDQI